MEDLGVTKNYKTKTPAKSADGTADFSCPSMSSQAPGHHITEGSML